MTKIKPRSLRLSIATAALTLGLGPNLASAASPFLPAPKQIVITPSFSYQSFDEFSPGGNDTTLPQNLIRRHTRAHFDLGITDNVAFDASLGYASVNSVAGSEKSLGDTYLGLRYRFADESKDGYAAAYRFGVTLPGSYETGQLHTPGDGAAGLDLSASISKHLGGIFRGTASAGYYYNSEDVPNSYAVQLKADASFSTAFKGDVSWKYFSGVNGLDIGGPGFTGLNDLPKVKERGHVIELGLAYNDQGKRYYRIYASQLINGRNVGEERTYGASVSFTF